MDDTIISADSRPLHSTLITRYLEGDQINLLKMVDQESLLSVFPLVPQDGLQSSRSSFVRAHVMSGYHRKRRAKKFPKHCSNDNFLVHRFVATTEKLQWQEINGVHKPPRKRSPENSNIALRIGRVEAKVTEEAQQPQTITNPSSRKTRPQSAIAARPRLFSFPLKTPIKDDSTHFLRIINSCKCLPNQ